MIGAAAMPRAAARARASVRTVEIESISVLVSSALVLFLYSARIGTNACEKAPSANRRRSRLGILKATKKASVARPAPKARAMMKSRTKPSTRLTMVRLLTAARARSRFMLEFRPFQEPRPVHGEYQVSPQACPPGGGTPRAQHEPAHHRAHGDQERGQGGRRRQEGRRGCGAARLAARHRPRGGEGNHAPQRG